jgi:CheY-like chemotaxis protein
MYFVDWKMPDVSGIELSCRIRAIHADANVIVMTSSVEWQEVAEEAKGAGIDTFLPKPIFPSAFIECINTAFGVDLLNEGKNEKTKKIDRLWGYRVLLVEDVEINREIVMALLEPTLVEVDCAENGAEGVRMFSENPDKYNIVFMDLQMPVMDGYNATRAIRALNNEQAKAIPIIAMTANVFKEDVENCLNAGMNDHLGKPLDFDDVLRILRHYLFNQKPAKERRKGERRKNNPDRRQTGDRRKADRRQGD